MIASVVIHPGVNFGIFEVLERNPYQSCVLGAAKADFDVFYQKTTAIFSVKTELWNLYMKSHTSPSLPLRRLMREALQRVASRREIRRASGGRGVAGADERQTRKAHPSGRSFGVACVFAAIFFPGGKTPRPSRSALPNQRRALTWRTRVCPAAPASPRAGQSTSALHGPFSIAPFAPARACRHARAYWSARRPPPVDPDAADGTSTRSGHVSTLYGIRSSRKPRNFTPRDSAR